VSGSLAAYVYEKTLAPSQLRNIIIEIGVCNMPSRTFNDDRDRYPNECLQDVCSMVFSKREMKASYESEHNYEWLFERNTQLYHVDDGNKKRKFAHAEEELN
jgi:hypothetical protein